MLSKVHSAANFGLESIEVDIEVNIADKGFPGFTIVGINGKSGEEIKERVKTALINCDIEFPMAKVTINLAPADLAKEGTSYDLPIAVGILQSMGEINQLKEKSYFFGELSLDGSLRHTKGVFLLALLAKENGVRDIFVPRLSANEATVLDGVNIIPVDNLKNLIKHLRGEKLIEPLKKIESNQILGGTEVEFNFCEIFGQEQAKRAMEIAAAGGHNLFLLGPPGSGKTMISRALPGILPELSENESMEVTKIFSITGNIPPGGSLVRIRSFRNPHHTISQVGMIGGGSIPRPGEVTLAHRGVLFLDEFPEFGRSTLEALRQPIEDGKVSISRANGKITFPSQFMLVAAANPCPCGYLGDPKKACKCTVHSILNFKKKLSGPVMDRIDMHITVPTVESKHIFNNDEVNNSEKSEDVRKRVLMCRQKQINRFRKCGLENNAEMKNKHIKEFVTISPEANMLLRQAMDKFRLSTRTYFRIIKLSQTIADLAGEDRINMAHIAEALQYRVREDVNETV